MLPIIVATIFIATTFNILLKKCHIPTIIGYILTGVIIAFFFHIPGNGENSNLKLIAEFGIVFLMFTIGLEFSIFHLIKMRKSVFIIGGLQFLLTSFIIMLFMHYYMQVSFQIALIIGTGLSMSSTAIILKILHENNDINKKYGQKSLGVLLFQDLAVIPVLLMISIFANGGGAFSLLLGKALLSIVFLCIFLYFFGKFFLNYFLEKVSLTHSNEIFIGAILFLVVGSSYLSHSLGLSYSLGALLAGIMIAETHFKHKVEAGLVPFRDLLLGIFFVSVGIQLDFVVIYENFGVILLLLFSLIFTKILVLFGILKFMTQKIVALKTAITLFQFGEFGIVIFELATAEGLLPSGLSQILIVLIILSMIITPFVLKNIDSLAQLFLGKNKKGDEQSIDDDLSGHIILIGYGRLGKIVARLLKKDGYSYVVLENDLKTFSEAKQAGEVVIFGSASEKQILDSLHIEKAQSIIISIGQSKKLYLICEMIAQVASNSQIIVKVHSYEQKEKLETLCLSNIIVESEETAISILENIKTA